MDRKNESPYQDFCLGKNPVFSEVHRFKILKRTDGDGMEIDRRKVKTDQNLTNCSDQLLHGSVEPKAYNLPVSLVADNTVYEYTKWEEEKRNILEELNRLKAENTELENQVKYHVQVNVEIKKLLVAALGEDMETRLQSLAEDKLNLAKQLLNTAKTLSTHQEQIEWLAGQCEVWRSKFLSSSVLVEDLAKWKAGLRQQLTQYENILKRLLNDNKKMKKLSFQTFVNLSTLQEKFNLNVISEENGTCQVVSLDLVNLCAFNYELSEILLIQLLRENIIKKNFELDAVNSSTSAEKEAQQALSQPMISFNHTDVACTAVMTGAAIALSSAAPRCSHCNGVVQTV